MFAKDISILVVDDMMTMRKLVKKSLMDLGFTKIDEADNGENGWNKVQAAQASGTGVQLIISDWNMPQMTGVELLKRVRSNPTTANIAFIILTAESEKSQVIEAAQFKVSGYMTKPFTTAQIEEKLKAAFGVVQKAA